MTGVICADNLEVLAQLPPGGLDLIYIDPPFATGRPRTGPAGSYADPARPDALLAHLCARLPALHRALRATGSLFVHLDWRAAHAVKLELDRVFGAAALVNEIVWCYSVGGKGRRTFGRKHDTIFWYGRSPEYSFYPDAVRVPRKSGSHMRVVRDPAGRPIQVKRDARTGKLYSYPVDAGKIPDDCWTDIQSLNRSDRERTGWPTQKPEALLARIIRATTQPGDLVADFYCGSGTTAVVAARLGRRWLAVDVAPAAVAITRARLLAVEGARARPG
jgi:DNA modification methylase